MRYNFLSFSYYIRAIIESFLILILSVVSEIYRLQVNDASSILSFIFWIIVLIILLLFTIFSLWLLLKKNQDDESNKYKEFFNGMKKKFCWRLFITIWMLRRLIFVLLFIILTPISPILTIQILSFIQLAYFIILLVIRPYTEIKDNLVEIINEVFLWVYIYFGSGIITLKRNGIIHQVVYIVI